MSMCVVGRQLEGLRPESKSSSPQLGGRGADPGDTGGVGLDVDLHAFLDCSPGPLSHQSKNRIQKLQPQCWDRGDEGSRHAHSPRSLPPRLTPPPSQTLLTDHPYICPVSQAGRWTVPSLKSVVISKKPPPSGQCQSFWALYSFCGLLIRDRKEPELSDTWTQSVPQSAPIPQVHSYFLRNKLEKEH